MSSNLINDTSSMKFNNHQGKLKLNINTVLRFKLKKYKYFNARVLNEKIELLLIKNDYQYTNLTLSNTTSVKR